jgi:hypothetical protein
MKKFIKYEFSESVIHQKLFEILINKYNIKTYDQFEKARLCNIEFEEEFEILYDSYEEFINDSIK